MKSWKITIDLSVNDVWIEDGFNAVERQQEIEDAIRNMLPYAYSYEMSIKIKIEPKQKNK